jgi:hypothetical protein
LTAEPDFAGDDCQARDHHCFLQCCCFGRAATRGLWCRSVRWGPVGHGGGPGFVCWVQAHRPRIRGWL